MEAFLEEKVNKGLWGEEIVVARPSASALLTDRRQKEVKADMIGNPYFLLNVK
jgi:hypothetical protein